MSDKAPVSDQQEIENLERGDFVMAFDPEYDVWFKYKVLKATENYYVLGAVAYDNNDLKPCVHRKSDLLESENDVNVKWRDGNKYHACFIRVVPGNIPPSVQEMRKMEAEHIANAQEV